MQIMQRVALVFFLVNIDFNDQVYANAASSVGPHSVDTKLAIPTVPVDRVFDPLGGILN